MTHESNRAGMNIRRGLKMAAVYGLIGYLAITLGMFLLTPLGNPETLIPRRNFSVTAYYSEIFIQCSTGFFRWITDVITNGWSTNRDIRITLIAITLFSSAGWASYAPDKPYRYIETLTILFLISTPFWIIANLLTMIHLKGFPELFLTMFILPPVIISCYLSHVREKKSPQSQELNSVKPSKE